MLDKYFAFCKLMGFLAEHAKIIDADMNNYAGKIEIRGVSNGQEIIITTEFKEVNKDGD